MIVWIVTMKVSYYNVEYTFETADEAVAFAKTAMKGVYDDKHVTVSLRAEFKEEANE